MAQSSTSMVQMPPGTTPGISPRSAARMIFPVGVGATSPGPKGNAGFTMTSDMPLLANESATRSLSHLVMM